MHNWYGKEISDEIRQGVRDDLTMLNEIEKEEVRDWVVEAWATSLHFNNFSAIHELQGSGLKDHAVEKNGNQATHLNGVAMLAKAMGEVFLKKNPDFDIDIDIMIASALLHDVGKTIEFNMEKRELWMNEPWKEGTLGVPHTAYGYYICKLIGLPDYLCHVAMYHCREADGRKVFRSIYCDIVHRADYAYWHGLLILGALDPTYSYSEIHWAPYQSRMDFSHNWFKEIVGDRSECPDMKYDDTIPGLRKK